MYISDTVLALFMDNYTSLSTFGIRRGIPLQARILRAGFGWVGESSDKPARSLGWPPYLFYADACGKFTR